jgi:hypothetical protein
MQTSSDTAEKRRHQESLDANSGKQEDGTDSDNSDKPDLKGPPEAAKRRNRADSVGDEQWFALQPAVRPSTLASTGSMYQRRPVPTQTSSAPSCWLLPPRPGAAVSQTIGAVSAPQAPLYGFLSHQALPSALQVPLSQSLVGAQSATVPVAPMSDLERLQILHAQILQQQAYSQTTVASRQYQAPLSVASLASMSQFSPSSLMPSSQISNPGSWPIVPMSGGNPASTVNQQGTTGSLAGPAWPQHYLRPHLTFALAPATAEVPGAIHRPESNLTLRQLLELLQRRPPSRENPP